jgi:hypothetical protein
LSEFSENLSGGTPVPSAPVESVRGDYPKSERTGGITIQKVSGPRVVTAGRRWKDRSHRRCRRYWGELFVAARNGLLALSVGVGLSVVQTLMEAQVSQVVGPNGKHNPDRAAKRHGDERG